MAWDRKRLQARERLDERLGLLHPVERFRRPPKGWIRAVRDAIGMPAEHLGKLMGIRRQSIGDLEQSEARGAITLDALRRAAAAMDCTLVYALVPNSSLADIVEHRANVLARSALSSTTQTMALEDQAVPEDAGSLRLYIDAHISERDLWS